MSDDDDTIIHVTREELQQHIDEIETQYPEIVGAVSDCCAGYCHFDWDWDVKQAARARDTWKWLMGEK